MVRYDLRLTVSGPIRLAAKKEIQSRDHRVQRGANMLSLILGELPLKLKSYVTWIVE